MSVIMFQSRFASKVKDGSKPHTIRLPRKRPIKVGEKLSLREWIGKPYRSKQRVLREAICRSVAEFHISETGASHMIGAPFNFEELARNDGFRSYNEMIEWFKSTHGLPFDGVLIGWETNDQMRDNVSSEDNVTYPKKNSVGRQAKEVKG